MGDPARGSPKWRSNSMTAPMTNSCIEAPSEGSRTQLNALLAEIELVHRAILAPARSLKDAAHEAQSPAALGLYRRRLAMAVRERLPAQQTLMSAMRMALGSDTAAFDRLLDDDRELRLAYSKHISSWTGGATNQNFAGYKEAVETLVVRLDRHFRDVRTEIARRL